MKFGGVVLPDAASETQSLLTEIWQKNLHILVARLGILDRAAAAALCGTITQQDCEEAASISHKLAGSLGMFGYHRGSEIGRELEQLFLALPNATSSRIASLTSELRHLTVP